MGVGPAACTLRQHTSHFNKAVSWCWTISVSLSKPFSTVIFSTRDSLPRTQSHFVSRNARERSVR